MVCAYVLLRRYMERVVLVPENVGGLKDGGSNTLQILVTLMFHISTYDSEQASSFIRLWVHAVARFPDALPELYPEPSSTTAHRHALLCNRIHSSPFWSNSDKKSNERQRDEQ